MAAAELNYLKDTIDQHRSLVRFYIPPKQPGHGLRIDLKAQSNEEINEILNIAPTTVAILDGLVETDYEGLQPRAFFPGFVTVNYAAPGEMVTKHVDAGRKGVACLAQVLPIQGVGDFYIGEPEKVLKNMGPGDMYEFDNPADVSERLAHYAVNIGDIERITLAYQLSLVALGT